MGLEKSVERVNIQNTLLIPQDVKKICRSSPNKYKFLNELKVHLMEMEVSAKIYPSFEELESINIADFIYFDGFSRNKLIHEISWPMRQTWYLLCGKNLRRAIFLLGNRNISGFILLLNRFILLIHTCTLQFVGISSLYYAGSVGFGPTTF